MVYFNNNPGTFDSQLWIKGSIGSMCNVLGFTFINLAIDTGKEIDLIFAWNLSQTLIVLIAESIISWTLPDWV